MQRRTFILRAAGSLAVVALAAQPLLASAQTEHRTATISIRRHGMWGAVPGGCGDHRRRSRSFAGYTRADAFVRFAR